MYGLRKKIYRGCLWTALILTVFTLCLLWLLGVYRKIPDNIKLRRGEEQVIDIGVPVEGIIKKTDSALWESRKTECRWQEAGKVIYRRTASA